MTTLLALQKVDIVSFQLIMDQFNPSLVSLFSSWDEVVEYSLYCIHFICNKDFTTLQICTEISVLMETLL